MATSLYRIGRWAFRRRRLVGGLGLGALFLPGTEARKAFDLLQERR